MKRNDYKATILLTTMILTLSLLTAGIVPGDPCQRTPAYMDWNRIYQFLETPIGKKTVLGAGTLTFLIVLLLTRRERQ